MSYTPENNPYIPGDPYSYDLKWMADNIKHMEERFGELDDQVQEATDQADRAEDEADRAVEEANRSRDEADRADSEALVSEGYAKGTQDGEAVSSGSPYYENNSKYYSLKSADSASDAAASALEVADYASHISDPVSGLVAQWLSDNITQPTVPAIDRSLSVEGAGADAEMTGGILRGISEETQFRVTQTLNKFIDGVTHLLDDHPYNTRITNTEILYADHEIVLECSDPDVRYSVTYFSSSVWISSNYITNTPWIIQDSYTIPKGSYYVVQLDAINSTTFTQDDQFKLHFDDIVYNEDISGIDGRLDALEAKPTLYHIIVTGQSLAVGAEGNPALTTLTPYTYIGKTFQFNGGSRPIDGMENDTGIEEIAILDKCLEDFGSLCEQDHTIMLNDGMGGLRPGYQGETICSAMGYHFAKKTGEMVLVSDHGFGGKNYNQLKKGTTAYENSLRAVYHAKHICERYGWNYKVFAIAVVHGEADQDAEVTANTYKNYLEEWQDDYDADIKAITGQTENIKLFASQTASASAYNKPEATVSNGVFLAAIEDPDIYLVCPQYCYPLTYASVHMNNYGYRYLGEFFGYEMGRVFENESLSVVYPTSSVYSANTITLTLHALQPLAEDGSNVAAVLNDGFALINDSNNVSITNVSVSGYTVTITLDGAPSNDSYISYAYKVLPGEMGYIGSQRGLRGNIKSTSAFTSMFTGIYCPPWCAMFCIPINWSE